MKYGRPIITLLLLGGVITYFSIGNTFDKALEKERLKLSSEVTALSGQEYDILQELSGVRYQLSQKQNKLATLNSLNDSKPIVEGKKDTQVCTNGFAKCLNGDTVTLKDVCWENYKFQEDGQIFAGYSGIYYNGEESCIIFHSEEEMNIALSE